MAQIGQQELHKLLVNGGMYVGAQDLDYLL